jgi:integrase
VPQPAGRELGRGSGQAGAVQGKRPSLIQAWISGMQLGPGSARQVIRDVSSVFIAAIDDGLVARNPVQAKSVTSPKAPENKARPWTLDQVDAMAGALPPRFAVLPYLGAGAGMRQGELFGLAVDDADLPTPRDPCPPPGAADLRRGVRDEPHPLQRKPVAAGTAQDRDRH